MKLLSRFLKALNAELPQGICFKYFKAVYQKDTWLCLSIAVCFRQKALESAKCLSIGKLMKKMSERERQRQKHRQIERHKDRDERGCIEIDRRVLFIHKITMNV